MSLLTPLSDSYSHRIHYFKPTMEMPSKGASCSEATLVAEQTICMTSRDGLDLEVPVRLYATDSHDVVIVGDWQLEERFCNDVRRDAPMLATTFMQTACIKREENQRFGVDDELKGMYLEDFEGECMAPDPSRLVYFEALNGFNEMVRVFFDWGEDFEGEVEAQRVERRETSGEYVFLPEGGAVDVATSHEVVGKLNRF